jgi:transposase
LKPCIVQRQTYETDSAGFWLIVAFPEAKMRQKSGPVKESAEKVVKDIRRATRRHFSAEDKIRIVLEGLRGEESIEELCRREGTLEIVGLSGDARPRSARLGGARCGSTTTNTRWQCVPSAGRSKFTPMLAFEQTQGRDAS